jgi:hypothetical protein
LFGQQDPQTPHVLVVVWLLLKEAFEFGYLLVWASMPDLFAVVLHQAWIFRAHAFHVVGL